MSGGGRCNFTNTGAGPENFLSANPHYCKSALARYTPADFIAMIERHGIAYHEKELGQLFCDESSKRSEEHTSELQSLMRISYAVFCLTKKKTSTTKSNNILL